MSKIFVLVALVIGSFASARESSERAQIHKKKGQFFARAEDPEGFVREYKILNTKKFIYDCMRTQGQWVQLKGKFVEQGRRAGTVEISEFGQDVDDPLSLGSN